MSLNPDQFRIEDQGESPLYYNRFGGLPRRRLGLIHPDAPSVPVVNRASYNERSVRDVEYWAPEVQVGRGLNDRRLKTPKVVKNPSAAKPGTVGFLDYTEVPHGDGGLYVDFVNRRFNMPQMGVASRLLHFLSDQNPNVPIDLGKVLSPKVWEVGEELKAKGREIRGQNQSTPRVAEPRRPQNS